MKEKVCLIAILCLFFSVSNSLYSIGEKTIRLGGDSIWKMADYREGIVQQDFVRANTVLMLSNARASTSVPGSDPDMSLSFDEGNTGRFGDSVGHYRINVPPSLTAVDHRYARTGSGAVLFSNSSAEGALTIEARSSAALFAPNNNIYDFTIEFWLHPLNMENGEQILLWDSNRPARNTGSNNSVQQILCVSARNRLQWSFHNFFSSPDRTKTIDINIAGVSAIVPKTWSHHLIRFDSVTGMVEYLVNGRAEVIVYANSTGREGGEVFTPITGRDGRFALGGSYSGLMDEFKVYGSQIPRPDLRKYSLHGGRIETRAIDLGAGYSGAQVLKVEASGGKTSISSTRISSEFRQNGIFRFSDNSEMQFFIRASNNPYRWDAPWQPVTPGADLAGNIQGRYVQLAVDFYSSANGEASPYLEELRIIYFPDEPPLPPAQLTAFPLDSAVELRWKHSPDQSVQGYLVYYGTSSDDYFGEDAALGVSPIDVGRTNSIKIDGLRNGVLYFFRVASYNDQGPGDPGEFSREVRARPLQGSVIN